LGKMGICGGGAATEAHVPVATVKVRDRRSSGRERRPERPGDGKEQGQCFRLSLLKEIGD